MSALDATLPVPLDTAGAARTLLRGAAFVTGLLNIVVLVTGIVWMGLAIGGRERAAAADVMFDTALAVLASALMLSVLLVGGAAADRAMARGLTWLSAIVAGVTAIVSALRAGGSISESVQLSVLGLLIVLMIAWLFAVGPAGHRTGVFGAGLARFARLLAVTLTAAMAVFVFAALFPEGSRGREVVVTLGAIPAIAAWIALPVWWMVTAFRAFPASRRAA